MKVLLLSDIHGNWPALQGVLRAEPDAAQIICLGDLVNYGPQPVECVVWAMRLAPPSLVVQGNEDWAFGAGASPNCVPPYHGLATAVQAATSPMLAPEMRRFLAKLHRFQRFPIDGADCVACHSTVRNKEPLQARPGLPSQSWPWESDLILAGHFDEPFVLLGHPKLLFLAYTHSPLKVDWMDTLIVNPGSVGKPMDGDPRAAYAVWEDGEVTLRRAEYDVEETVRAYDSLPLDEGARSKLVEELRTGGRVREHAVEVVSGS